MYINPKKLIESGIVKNVLSEKSIQPNAIDFSLDVLHKIDHKSPAYISNDKSKNIFRARTEVQLGDLRDHGHMYGSLKPTNLTERAVGWHLEPGAVYDGQSNIYVEVPEGMVATLVIRSTFNRNAVFISSGFYDSGFKGNIGFTIHNLYGHTFIEQGTLIGQIAFAVSDSEGEYAGGYNTADGQHWTEVVKSPLEVITDSVPREDLDAHVDQPAEVSLSGLPIVNLEEPEPSETAMTKAQFEQMVAGTEEVANLDVIAVKEVIAEETDVAEENVEVSAAPKKLNKK